MSKSTEGLTLYRFFLYDSQGKFLQKVTHALNSDEEAERSREEYLERRYARVDVENSETEQFLGATPSGDS